MRKLVRRLVVGAALFAVLVAATLWGVYQASRQAPEFYRQALHPPREALDEGSQQFERQALALHNQLRHAGGWEVRFTQDEINGWLAADFPAKFPRALPPGISDPRIAIDGTTVRLALHYQRGSVDTVVSLVGDAWLTDQPNEIAVRIAGARAGLVPVPLANFLQEITERTARAGLPLRWSEAKGAPVAIIRLPLDHDNAQHRRVLLERLQFTAGTLLVAGRTESQAPTSDETGESTTAAQPEDSEIRQR
jgi:hypothetical protein